MNETRTRAQEIQKRLDNHFLNEIGVAVATPEPVWWWERHELYGSLSILGWAWPAPNLSDDPMDSELIVAYCPQIIDQIVSEMDDANFDAYLSLIEYVVDLHIVHWDDYPDGDERHRIVLAQMEDEMPVFVKFLNEGLAMASLKWLADEWTE